MQSFRNIKANSRPIASQLRFRIYLYNNTVIGSINWDALVKF